MCEKIVYVFRDTARDGSRRKKQNPPVCTRARRQNSAVGVKKTKTNDHKKRHREQNEEETRRVDRNRVNY